MRLAAPKSIPNSAFLQVADTNGEEPVADTPSEDVLPVALRRDVRQRPGHRPGAQPPDHLLDPAQPGQRADGTFRQTIRVYEAGGAARFLDEVREAVADCPTDGDQRYRMVSAPRHGDESLMFELGYPFTPPDGTPNGDDDVRLVSVVRIGEVVTVLYETGWEAGWSAKQDVVNAFTGKAVTRIRSWLD